MQARFKDEKEAEKRRRKNEESTILWLAKTLKMDDEEIKKVLKRVRDNSRPYKTILVKKRSGGKPTAQCAFADAAGINQWLRTKNRQGGPGLQYPAGGFRPEPSHGQPLFARSGGFF